MRRLLPIALLAGALLAPIGAGAQPAETTDKRVVVSPFVYARPTDATASDATTQAVVTGMESYLDNAGAEFSLIPFSTVTAAVLGDPGHDQLVDVAAEWAEIGFAKYRDLDTAGAADSLARAYSQYREAGHEFVKPRVVSEVLLYLALAALERGGDVMGPLDVMKQMLILDPAREIERGAFPDEVVQFYDSARLALERDVRERGSDLQFARRLAGRANADYVLTASVLPNPDQSVELVVWRYDTVEEEFGDSASMRISDVTPARLTDASNRLASQLISCLATPSEKPVDPTEPSNGESPFALQLNFAYASYYQFHQVPSRPVEPFANLGANVAAEYYLTREFALVAMFQFLASTSEFSGLVQPGFTTLRTFGGGELGIDIGAFRLSLGTLLEATAVSEIVLCTGREKGRSGPCVEAMVVEPEFLLGMNVRPRLSFRALESLRFFAAASTSFYFVPLTGGDLNYLTTAEVGIQYRF